MTSSSLSALGLQLLTTTTLSAQQTQLANLTEELSSNQQHSNLTDYTPLQAQQLLNFQDSITQRQAYVASMQTVSTRLTIYNSTMGDLETVASQAAELANQNPSQNASQTGIIQQQVLSYLQQSVTDLNQQVGSRYIYSGSRYSTPPVSLSAVLNNVTPSATLAAQSNATPNNLPSYDTNYGTTDATTVSQAWAKDSATIDSGDSLNYGITSTQPGFQQVIAGLQFMNAATQSGTTAAQYQSDMTQASTLLNQGLTNIQTYNAQVAAATNTVSSETLTQNNDISSLQQQIGNVQSVDLTEVGTELNLLQTQLQASYSATATITQDSILKYL